MNSNIQIKVGTPEQMKTIEDFQNLIRSCDEVLVGHQHNEDGSINYIFFAKHKDFCIRYDHILNSLKNQTKVENQIKLELDE